MSMLKKELTDVLKFIKSRGVVLEMEVRTHFAGEKGVDEHRKILMMLNALWSNDLIEYSTNKRGDNCVKALATRFQ